MLKLAFSVLPNPPFLAQWLTRKSNSFKPSDARRTPSPSLPAKLAEALSESMVLQSMSLNLLSSEPRSMNQWSCSERNDSLRLTSESEPEEVVILLNFMQSDKLFLRQSSPTTKNSRTSNPREKLRKFFFNTTEPSSSLIQEDLNQRNTAVLVPDPENKNHTDKSRRPNTLCCKVQSVCGILVFDQHFYHCGMSHFYTSAALHFLSELECCQELFSHCKAHKYFVLWSNSSMSVLHILKKTHD